MSIAGLFLIARAGAIGWAIFGAATLYGAGKGFFWPTTLGVVSEQFPKGGSLTLNAISGVGMISVGVLGTSFLGTLQDVALDRNLSRYDKATYQMVAAQPQTKFALTFHPLDDARIAALPSEKRAQLEAMITETKQTTIAKFSILSAVMMLCYLVLRLYFAIHGGYKKIE